MGQKFEKHNPNTARMRLIEFGFFATDRYCGKIDKPVFVSNFFFPLQHFYPVKHQTGYYIKNAVWWSLHQIKLNRTKRSRIQYKYINPDPSGSVAGIVDKGWAFISIFEIKEPKFDSTLFEFLLYSCSSLMCRHADSAQFHISEQPYRMYLIFIWWFCFEKHHVLLPSAFYIYIFFSLFA